VYMHVSAPLHDCYNYDVVCFLCKVHLISSPSSKYMFAYSYLMRNVSSPFLTSWFGPINPTRCVVVCVWVWCGCGCGCGCGCVQQYTAVVFFWAYNLYWQILEFRMHWKHRPHLTFFQASWSESLIYIPISVSYYLLNIIIYLNIIIVSLSVSVFLFLSLACRVYFGVFP
jgi:hypothetical protein